MKTQINGRYVNKYTGAKIFIYDVGFVLAVEAFKQNRMNGNETDNPARKMPEDGQYTWVKGIVKEECVYGVKNGDYYKYEICYDQGPRDKAWMEEKDKNYLQRIEHEGELKKLESAIYYLRLKEHATNNIRDWWTEKLKLEEPQLRQLLDQAEEESITEVIAGLEQGAKNPADAIIAQVTVPEEYRCSITAQIMIDPVIAADGNTYEREAITAWLVTKNHNTSPLTGAVLEHKLLISNNAMKSSINSFLTQNPRYWETDDIYSSENLKCRLIQAIIKERNKNEVDRILAIDLRLLTKELNVEHQNLLALAICSNPEILQLVITKLGDAFLRSVEKEKNGLIKLLSNVAVYLGIEGVRVVVTKLNWKVDDYQRALDNAINSSDARLVDICLKLGADINAKDIDGNPSLHRAVLISHHALVEVILASGARIDEQNKEGNTALHLALNLKYYELATRLIIAGANLETQNSKGDTALLVATKANSVDLVKLMLERHANIAAQTQEQNTALHVAAGQGNKDIALLLLQNKANGKAKNAQKKKPADIAHEAGYDDLAQFIETQRLEMKFMSLPFFGQLRQEIQEQRELALRQQQLIQQQQAQIAELTA